MTKSKLTNLILSNGWKKWGNEKSKSGNIFWLNWSMNKLFFRKMKYRKPFKSYYHGTINRTTIG